MKSMESRAAAWSGQIRAMELDQSIIRGISRDWQLESPAADEGSAHYAAMPLQIHAGISSDLAFNIRFERCRMELTESVAAFLFDIVPHCYSRVEEGALCPSQAQIFRMLTLGFNIESAYGELMSDSAIFAIPEFEYRMLRKVARLGYKDRRSFSERVDFILQDLSVDIIKSNRAQLVRVVMMDVFGVA